MRRIVIVGAGFIATKHAEAVHRLLPDCELHVADTNPAALAKFSEQFPTAVLHTSVESILGQRVENDEVAIVCTPPWLHLPHSMAALNSGRHVLCEKPLALSNDQVDQLWNCARENQRQLHCCSSRFSARPIVDNVRELIAHGAIGSQPRLVWMSRTSASRSGIEYQPGSRWFLDKSCSGGGSAMDWGCYDLAVWMQLLKPVKVVVHQAFAGYPVRGAMLPADVICNVEFQMVAALSLHLADGGIVPVQYERTTATHGPEISQFFIEGTHGAIDWDWLDWVGSSIRIRHDDDNGVSCVETLEGDSDGLSCHDRPLHQLLASIAGRESRAMANQEAVNTFRVLQALYNCAAQRQPVEIQF